MFIVYVSSETEESCWFIFCGSPPALGDEDLKPYPFPVGTVFLDRDIGNRQHLAREEEGVCPVDSMAPFEECGLRLFGDSYPIVGIDYQEISPCLPCGDPDRGNLPAMHDGIFQERGEDTAAVPVSEDLDSPDIRKEPDVCQAPTLDRPAEEIIKQTPVGGFHLLTKKFFKKVQMEPQILDDMHLFLQEFPGLQLPWDVPDLSQRLGSTGELVLGKPPEQRIDLGHLVAGFYI